MCGKLSVINAMPEIFYLPHSSGPFVLEGVDRLLCWLFPRRKAGSVKRMGICLSHLTIGMLLSKEI